MSSVSQQPKFTPGPWRLGSNEEMDDEDSGYAWRPILSDREVGRPVHLATIQNWSESVDEANGNLIAAAPEMYEALETVQAVMGLTLERSYPLLSTIVRDILAKANGGVTE